MACRNLAWSTAFDRIDRAVRQGRPFSRTPVCVISVTESPKVAYFRYSSSRPLISSAGHVPISYEVGRDSRIHRSEGSGDRSNWLQVHVRFILLRWTLGTESVHGHRHTDLIRPPSGWSHGISCEMFHLRKWDNRIKPSRRQSASTPVILGGFRHQIHQKISTVWDSKLS
jgi:hypothetical protein